MKHLTRIGVAFLAACILVSCGGCSKNETAEYESTVTGSETTTAATTQSTTTSTATTTEASTSAETAPTTIVTTAPTEPEPTETEAVTEAEATTTTTPIVYNTAAYELFQAAATKTNTMDSFDMDFSYSLTGSVDGETSTLGLSGNMKAIAQNDIIKTMSADMNMTMQTEEYQLSCYYADGILYENENGKKTKTVQDNLTADSEFGSLFSSFDISSLPVVSESDFYNTTMETTGDITTITMALTSEDAQKLLDPNSDTSTEMPDTTVTISVNNQNYITAISLVFSSQDATYGSYTMTISAKFNNPGQTVVIKAPGDLDEYTDPSESSDTSDI